ncbi:hypothetical protein LFYK43_09820 [Ligilactobacillus salitolerans]|uniref:NERD domain-containing protein n=1 Tax=Ligilactobacillus salitolerans TaxID=1808352 RepID=A0A401ISK0_9LACO|nr:NERD domain-containing protein [Ligilactobacillus salitolerans]GBG94523.1 hypothetical protein LFYK43_09820 [Ligilactobacillus salitolerans]
MRQKNLELQFLETLCRRTQLDTKEENQLYRLQQGFTGECQVDQLIKRLPKHPFVLDDLNIQFGQKVTQIDKLVLVGQTLYLLDVKDYQGKYTYQAGSWYHDGKILTGNILSQIDRARDILARILLDNNLSLTIEPVIIFVNPAVQLEIDDPASHTIKRLGEFADWFEQRTTAHRDPAVEQRLVVVLSKYQIPAVAPKADFSQQTHRSLHPGICCPHCHNFALVQKRYSLYCPRCRSFEPKEQAYVRTICEYGVLYFKQDLRRKELFAFFGEEYNRRYIEVCLKKFFKSSGFHGRSSYYINEGQEFRYLFANQMTYFKSLQKRISWR